MAHSGKAARIHGNVVVIAKTRFVFAHADGAHRRVCKHHRWDVRIVDLAVQLVAEHTIR